MQAGSGDVANSVSAGLASFSGVADGPAVIRAPGLPGTLHDLLSPGIAGLGGSGAGADSPIVVDGSCARRNATSVRAGAPFFLPPRLRPGTGRVWGGD